MDTTGFNQVGKFGTLSLLKRRTVAPAQGSELVTSFGIDSNDLTFGSSSTCGVRLYYPDVDAVHCKIMFEDRKAFLVIYGSEGVYVDGSWVYPDTSSSSEQPQTVVPLANDSEFEIHNKRFKFSYPPKELRPAITATPGPVSKRTLRLSMIHSAQVFSPRPSADPRENLKTLQSPLKGIFGIKTPTRPGHGPSRPRAVSPLKYGVSRPDSSDEDSGDDEAVTESKGKEKDTALASDDESDDEDEDKDQEQIILVETNHPRVVEEERDLVILEHLPAASAAAQASAGALPVPPSPGRALQQVRSFPQSRSEGQVQPQNTTAPPQTPRRKSVSGNALHRAVLIRSAQRAVWRAEQEKEEEEEEMEVMGAVEVDEDDDDSYEGEDRHGEVFEEGEDVEMRSVSSEEVSDPELDPNMGQEEEEENGQEADEAQEEDSEEEEEDPKTREAQKSLWRKSIERIIPWGFGGGSSSAKQEEEADVEDEEAELEVAEEPEASQDVADEPLEEEEEETQEEEPLQEKEEVAPLPAPATQTPIRRILGSFMTPQPQQSQAVKKNNVFPQTAARPSMPLRTSSEVAATGAGAASSSALGAGPGRLSLGGGEARRVMVQQPWKVKDLVVPPITSSKATPGPSTSSSGSSTGLSSAAASPMRRPFEAAPATPMRGGGPSVGQNTAGPAAAPRATPVVTEEEKRAIQERRRSAVREGFRADGFWKDGAPGMSPAKGGFRPGLSGAGAGAGGASTIAAGGDGRRSSSTSPVKMGARPLGVGLSMDMMSERPSSPTKGRALRYAIAEEPEDSLEPRGSILAVKAAQEPRRRSRSKSTDRGDRGFGQGFDEEEEEMDEEEAEREQEKEDTQLMLERMRETVDNMKRRKSMLPATPRFGLGGTPMATMTSSVAAAAPLAPPVPSSVALATPQRPSEGGGGVGGAPYRMGSVKKIDFSHVTPAARSIHRGKSPARSFEDIVGRPQSRQEVEEDVGLERAKEKNEEPFSLLRPGRQEMRTPMASTSTTRQQREPEPVSRRAEVLRERGVPVVAEASGVAEDSDEEIEVPKPRPRGRPRAPQTPKASEVAEDVRAAEAEPAPVPSKSTKPPSKPRSRTAKSPAPEPVAESSTLAPPVRRGRSRTPQPQQIEEDLEEPEPPKRSVSSKRTRRGTAEPEETLAPPAPRRGRSKTPQPVQVEEEEDEEPEPPKRSAGTSRTTRRGTAEPEERTVVAAPARRGRKHAVDPEEVEEPAPEPVKTPAAKRGRKPKVVPTVVEDEEEEDEEPAPVVAPAKRGRPRKPAATADGVEAESTQPVASGSKAKSSIPVKAAAKGRKNAVAAEEEEVVEEEDGPTPLARGRTAKSNIAAPKASGAAKTPAVATAAASKLAKPRGRPKTPATAPAATTSRTASSSALATGKSEKENTPGAGSNSVASDEAEDQPVKVRVSRKTTAATTAASAKPSRIATKSATKATVARSTSRTKAKPDEDPEEEEAPAKPRATRIMRARTKTG